MENIKQDESPKLSAREQSVHDAMSTPEAVAAVAKMAAAQALPLDPKRPPLDLKEFGRQWAEASAVCLRNLTKDL